MTGKFRLLCATVLAISSLSVNWAASAADKKPAEPKAAEPKVSAEQAQATFSAKFAEYKTAIAEIEKLQAQFQTADSAQREKLNKTMTAQVAHAQSLVNAMVEAGEAAYRAAPNKDPDVANLLFTVAKYYTIGQQIGPGAPGRRNPDDLFFPIDGGGQYEKALPIAKTLIDGGAPNKEIYVYGFLSAFMTNDFD